MNFAIYHDDVIKWRHQMEIFSALLAICAGNSPVPGEFPAHKSSLICVRINGRVNNRKAGDLRRYRAHHDVIVMILWMRLGYQPRDVMLKTCYTKSKRFVIHIALSKFSLYIS